MTLRRALAAAVLIVTAWSSSRADVPMLLNYQGHLTDASGNPENGSFTMDFAVFDAESGGTQLPSGTPWDETQSVQVTDGVFNVLLGSVTPLPADLFMGGPSDSFGPRRYLQVTVSGETLYPRRRIASAAYAISAGTDISARLVNSTTVSVSQNTEHAVPFDTELWDTDNMHDPGDNTKLTAQTAGRYLIFAHVDWETDFDGSRRLSLRLNGSTFLARVWQMPVTDGNSTSQSITTHFDLQEGDYVQAVVAHSSSTTNPLLLVIDAGGDPAGPAFGMVKLP